MDYKKLMIITFMGVFGMVSWGLHLYIISNAILQGGALGTVSLRFNKYNEMIIEFLLILFVFCLYFIFTIYISKKGVD